MSPTRAPHPCATSGCPELVVHGSHCPGHEATRRQKDPEQERFYGSARWKAIRALVRRQQPICRICHVNPTSVIDHRDGDWKNNDLSNLRGLCTSCNASHTARQHRAKAR